jgi:hypothetical protein
MVTRTRFSVPFLRILPVFSTSDFGPKCTRYALCYIAYSSERQKNPIPLGPCYKPRALKSPPTSCLPVSMSSYFLQPRMLVTSHTCETSDAHGSSYNCSNWRLHYVILRHACISMQYWCKCKSSSRDCCLLGSCCQPAHPLIWTVWRFKWSSETRSAYRWLWEISWTFWISLGEWHKRSSAASPVWDRCLWNQVWFGQYRGHLSR